MKSWIWGLILFIVGFIALAITYGGTSTYKTVIPFLDVIGAIEAIVTGVGFVILVIGIRSWHK